MRYAKSAKVRVTLGATLVAAAMPVLADVSIVSVAGIDGGATAGIDGGAIFGIDGARHVLPNRQAHDSRD